MLWRWWNCSRKMRKSPWRVPWWLVEPGGHASAKRRSSEGQESMWMMLDNAERGETQMRTAVRE
jgi:hypothetical protein